MRSKASVGGHPIHPALIPFPFAFLCGAFGFDLAGFMFAEPALWTTGYYLAVAGLVTGLLAAVPGFIDYLKTVPPQSSGRRRATRHMLLALATMALFLVAVLLRHDAAAQPTIAVLALEALGTALLAAAGSLGGTLVTRNQISVDHRFAGRRRWTEATVAPDEDGTLVAAASTELGVDQMKLLHAKDKRIVLARTTDGYVAFDDACTHEGGSLAGGTMICGTVQCPWHGSQFDSRTGCVRAGPAERGIAVYQVEERDGVVRIRTA